MSDGTILGSAFNSQFGNKMAKDIGEADKMVNLIFSIYNDFYWVAIGIGGAGIFLIVVLTIVLCNEFRRQPKKKKEE